MRYLIIIGTYLIMAGLLYLSEYHRAAIHAECQHWRISYLAQCVINGNDDDLTIAAKECLDSTYLQDKVVTRILETYTGRLDGKQRGKEIIEIFYFKMNQLRFNRANGRPASVLGRTKPTK